MRWLLGQLLLTLAGAGVVRLALRRQPLLDVGPVGTLGLSLLAGPALLGVGSTAFAVTGLGVAMPLLVLLLLPFAAVAAWPRRLGWEAVAERPQRSPGRRARAAGAQAVSAVLALVPVALLADVARRAPVASNDEYVSWALKGRALATTGELDPGIFLSSSYALLDYPLLLPSLVRWSDGLAGRADDGLAHLPVGLLLAGALLTTAWAVGRIAGTVAGWIATVLVATLPGVTALLGVFLFADVPLLSLGLGTALALLLWVHEAEPRWAALAGVLGAGALATKVEAVLFVGALLVAALLARPRRWRVLLLTAAGTGAAALPWLAWTRSHQLKSAFAAEGTFSRQRFDERRPFADAITEAYFDHWVGLVGPVALLAAAAVALGAWRGAGRLGLALSTWLSLVLGALWVQYLLYPMSDKPPDVRLKVLVAHVDSTADRVMLLPAALVLIAVPLLALAGPATPEPVRQRRRRKAPTGRDWVDTAPVGESVRG